MLDMFLGQSEQEMEFMPIVPLGEDEMDDDQFTLNDGAAHAAVGEGHAAQVFHQRNLKDFLAIKLVALKHTRVTGEVDALRLWVHSRRSDGVAVVDGITEIVGNLMFPKFLAALGVKAGQQFDEIAGFTFVPPKDHLAIDDDRAATAANVRRPSGRFS